MGDDGGLYNGLFCTYFTDYSNDGCRWGGGNPGADPRDPHLGQDIVVTESESLDGGGCGPYPKCRNRHANNCEQNELNNDGDLDDEDCDANFTFLDCSNIELTGDATADKESCEIGEVINDEPLENRGACTYIPEDEEQAASCSGSGLKYQNYCSCDIFNIIKYNVNNITEDNPINCNEFCENKDKYIKNDNLEWEFDDHIVFGNWFYFFIFIIVPIFLLFLSWTKLKNLKVGRNNRGRSGVETLNPASSSASESAPAPFFERLASALGVQSGVQYRQY